MTDTIIDFVEKSKELQRLTKEHNKNFRELFASGIRHLLVDVPTVKYVSWTQYTPYFNDGEPCVFGRGDPHVVLNSTYDAEGEDAESSHWWDEEYGYSFYSIYDYKKEPRNPVNCSDDEAKDIRKVLDSIRPLFEVDNAAFKTAFGDHVRVKITHEGLWVEEIDHD